MEGFSPLEDPDWNVQMVVAWQVVVGQRGQVVRQVGSGQLGQTMSALSQVAKGWRGQWAAALN